MYFCGKIGPLQFEFTGFAAAERGKDQRYGATINHQPLLDVFGDYTVLAH